MKKVFLVSIVMLCTLVASAQSNDKGVTPQSILYHLLHPSKDYVLVAAHRGDWKDQPENSIGALDGALREGADIIEIDVQKTKDNVLVLMHDQTIDRMTTGHGLVSELSWKELKEVFLKRENGVATKQHIPTLEEFMSHLRGKPILVDLDKCWSMIPEVYAILKKTGTVDQGLFKGHSSIQALRDQEGTIIDSLHYIPMVDPDNFVNKEISESKGMTYVNDFISAYNPIAFELNFPTETSGILSFVVPELKKKGISVWMNSLWGSLCADHDDDFSIENPDKTWGWLIEKGADVIQTDNPSELLAYLKFKKLRGNREQTESTTMHQ